MSAKHGRQLANPARPFQGADERSRPTLFHLFVHLKVRVAISGELRQVGDDDDLMSPMTRKAP